MKSTIAVLSLAAFSAAWNDDELYEAFDAVGEAWELQIDAEHEHAQAEYWWKKSVLAELDFLAQAVEQLQIFREYSEQQAAELRNDVDNNSNDIGYAFEEIAYLQNRSVFEDHFYVNEPGYMVEREYCFDPIILKVGQTIDISADFTTEVGDRDQVTNFGIWLQANGEWIAQGSTSEFEDQDKTASNNASLIYRQKVEEHSEFMLCYWASPSILGEIMTPGKFQWGYRIYGVDYETVMHTF